MSGPKTLTIGITVNLEHYENLRLEVSGEVGGQEDARELARFLYDVLGTYGAGDPATRECVKNFQRRVLPTTAIPPESQPVLCQESVCPIQEGTGSAVDMHPDLPDRVTTHTPVTNDPPPVPALKVPGKNEAGTEVACEDCGTPVNTAEQKMSMLFTSRTLCRKCLKKV